ncbi:MAG TPA: hypothetical protein GX711_10060, partial [Clostridia bacterium]|nr:hypothetical protein [Clostridia bacterium]
MRLWLLSGVDSWFFRGARSFRAGEGGVQHIASLFPPSIITLQGLVRLTLAMGKGWTPNQPATWPKEELGDEENLGKLRLQGPFLRYNERWFFPV